VAKVHWPEPHGPQCGVSLRNERELLSAESAGDEDASFAPSHVPLLVDEGMLSIELVRCQELSWVPPWRGLEELGGSLHSDALVRSLFVVLAAIEIESSSLKPRIGLRRLRGRVFEGSMEAFESSVLLRLPRLDSLRTSSESRSDYEVRDILADGRRHRVRPPRTLFERPNVVTGIASDSFQGMEPTLSGMSSGSAAECQGCPRYEPERTETLVTDRAGDLGDTYFFTRG